MVIAAALGPILPSIVGSSVIGSGGAAVVTTAIGGALIPGLAAGILPLALQAKGGPFDQSVRFPQIDLSEIGSTAVQIQRLKARGLQPVVSIDPFTGGQVLSTADQAPILERLLGEKFAREALAATPEEVTAVRDFREEVVRSLSSAKPRVFQPGQTGISSRVSATGRRLGGPCAGANTGFSRLNCARGGFS